jgi:hypothetical protein
MTLSGVQGTNWVVRAELGRQRVPSTWTWHDGFGAQVVQSPGCGGIPQRDHCASRTPGAWHSTLASPASPGFGGVTVLLLRTKPRAMLAKPTDIRAKKKATP